MLKRKHRILPHRFTATCVFCLLIAFCSTFAFCLNFEDWQKSSLENIYRLQCSLKCSSEFCTANCRKMIPRVLNQRSSSKNKEIDCGCSSSAAATNATSKSLPRQAEESRKNASRLLCERVCTWATEIVASGRIHAGSCPAPGQTLNNLLVASKLSVRSPPPLDEYNGGGRSDEFGESSISDQGSSEDFQFLRGGSKSRLATQPPISSGCGYKACLSDADCDWREKCCTGQSCMTRVCLQASVEEESADAFKIVSFSLDSDKRVAKFNWNPPRSQHPKMGGIFLLELKYLVVAPSHIADDELPDEMALSEQSREDRMSDWVIVANSSQATSIHLDSNVVWPSTWYRFRIVRLSANSPIAVSQPVGPVKIAKELREVTEPRNVTALAEQWFLNADDPESVDCTITWSPPLIADVPVTRYKIFYTQYVPSNVLAILSSPPEFKKSVPGHVTSIQLEQLIPETTYRVDIQAISRLPSVKMRSQKATVYIRTVALDEADDPPGASSTRRSTLSSPQTKTFDLSSDQGDSYSLSYPQNDFKLPPPVEGLTVGEVTGKQRLEVVVSWRAPLRPTQAPPESADENTEVFNDDEEDGVSSRNSNSKAQSPLRYIVEWAPLSCIQQEPPADSSQLGMSQIIRRLSLVTMNTSVTLHTLLPTCFYEVSVTTLDPANGLRGQKQTQTFRTPLCGSGPQNGPCNGDQVTTEMPQVATTVGTSSTTLRTATEEPVEPPERDASLDLPTPAPVHNLQFRPVADNGSILVQWDMSSGSQLLTPVELVFSWSVYPSLEPAAGQVRRLSPNRSRVIMQNLKPGLLYVVSVVSVARRQSDGEVLKSPAARIVVLLATQTPPTPSPGQPDSETKWAKESRSAESGSADHQLSSSSSSPTSRPIIVTLLLTFLLDLRSTWL